jgi:hypothetical protein
VRIFYLRQPTTQQGLQEITTVIRTIADVYPRVPLQLASSRDCTGNGSADCSVRVVDRCYGSTGGVRTNIRVIRATRRGTAH